jgi:hypothetical protein
MSAENHCEMCGDSGVVQVQRNPVAPPPRIRYRIEMLDGEKLVQERFRPRIQEDRAQRSGRGSARAPPSSRAG